MKAKEIFQIAVRLIGLIGVVYVGLNVYHVLSNFHGIHSFHWSAIFHLFLRFIFLLISLYFLRGAPALVRFAFDEEVDSYKSTEPESSKSHSEYVN